MVLDSNGAATHLCRVKKVTCVSSPSDILDLKQRCLVFPRQASLYDATRSMAARSVSSKLSPVRRRMNIVVSDFRLRMLRAPTTFLSPCY